MHKALAMQANTHTLSHTQSHSRTHTHAQKKNKQRGALTSVLSLFHSLLRSHDAASRHRRRNVNTQRKPISFSHSVAFSSVALSCGQRSWLLNASAGRANIIKTTNYGKSKLFACSRCFSLLLLLFLATCCLNKCAFRMRRERREQQQQHKFLSGERERCVV